MRKPISQRTKKTNEKAFDEYFKANDKSTRLQKLTEDKDNYNVILPCGCDPDRDELCGECNTDVNGKG